MKELRGRVIKIYGTVYYVKVENSNEIFSSTIKGKLKLLRYTKNKDETDLTIKERLKIFHSMDSKNPIVVGDFVSIQPLGNIEIKENGYNQAVITKIEPRINKISRTFMPNKKTIMENILVANIDFVLCINSVTKPDFNSAFVDRILVTCEREEIEPIIIVNKMDMDTDNSIREKVTKIYENLGYKLFFISAKNSKDKEFIEFKEFIKNKNIVLVGKSGVGKSTIINSLIGYERQKTNPVSNWSNKGIHTTTNSEFIEIFNNTYIIDTPGLREFGIYGIEKMYLAHYFRELRSFVGKCKYTQCTHSHEPDCKVKEFVENGTINRERYTNYIKILDTLIK